MNRVVSDRENVAVQNALAKLEEVIRRRFPDACFSVVEGDDPEGVYLKALVDIADVDEVVDQEILDLLFEYQVERSLPVYLIPLQPVTRVLTDYQAAVAARQLIPR